MYHCHGASNAERVCLPKFQSERKTLGDSSSSNAASGPSPVLPQNLLLWVFEAAGRCLWSHRHITRHCLGCIMSKCHHWVCARTWARCEVDSLHLPDLLTFSTSSNPKQEKTFPTKTHHSTSWESFFFLENLLFASSIILMSSPCPSGHHAPAHPSIYS